MLKTTKIFYCDRCGEKMAEDHTFYCDTYPNTAIEVLQNGGWAYADLCDKCKESFKAWWKETKQIAESKPQEKQCADCKHYYELFSLDCARCDVNHSMYEPQKSEVEE